MSIQSLKFARDTDNAHLHGDAHQKIFALLKQIHEVYNDHIRQPSGQVCEVCGKGDSGVHHKVGRILPGYEYRQDVMPRLCWPHASGWSRSYRAMESKRRADLFTVDGKSQVDILTYTQTPVISTEETDLHFAHFLAVQLLKVKNEINKQPQLA
jgi:hypothetical protein